jgi:hypothetical protein
MGKITKTLIAALAAFALAPAAYAAPTPVATPKATATATSTPAPVAIPAVTGVSATWVILEGFVVNWVPVSGAAKSQVRSYTVTSSAGQTCTVNGADANECVFSNSRVPFGFKPYVRYTFTVVANGATSSGPKSAPSNSAGWFGAPGYPSFVVAKTISDNQIDVKWIPDASTGGVSLSGYKVYYWPLNRDNEQKMVPSLDNSVSLTGLAKSTWYVIAVQSCNYYGCSTSDWAYQATTPAAASTATSLLPRVINGGNASTTCWDYVIDGGSPTSASKTVTKAPSACPVALPPTSWPIVDASATTSPNLPVATKFDAKSSFSLANASYSMSYKWNDLGITTGNFTRTRSLGVRTYESLTPQVCTIILKNGLQNAHFVAAGTCTIRMSIAADETYLATAPITASFVVKP